ncbi:MAG: DUF3108 domain-containing protein [Burkholderiales bacterium]
MKRLVLLLACVAFNAAAAELPKRVTITFEISRGSLGLGTGTEVLEVNGKNYSIISQTHPTGLAALVPKARIRRESRGAITEQGLRPLEFSEKRGNEQPAVSKFDWDKKLITFEREGATESAQLPKTTYDRLSIAYNFAFNSPPGKDLLFAMTDGKKLSEHHYVLLGLEKLETPLGQLQTQHWAKQREKETDRATDLWLAPDYFMLPVRIVFIDKDGARYEQIATQISYQ